MSIDINATVSKNLKQMREQKNLTLEAAAAATGVSRSMLASIEKGDVNPTLSILWKIADGYKVAFTSLLHSGCPKVTMVTAENTISVTGLDDKIVSSLIFPFDKDKGFESYYVSIMPGGLHTSQPHMDGTEEYVTVFNGKMEMTIDKEVFNLNAGDSIHFIGNVLHSYHNVGKTTLTYHNLIYYA